MSPGEYWRKEMQAQKWRALTPYGVVMTLASNVAIMGMLAWFSNYYIDEQQKKDALIFQKISQNTDKERTDFECLLKGMYQCCGDKTQAC